MHTFHSTFFTTKTQLNTIKLEVSCSYHGHCVTFILFRTFSSRLSVEPPCTGRGVSRSCFLGQKRHGACCFVVVPCLNSGCHQRAAGHFWWKQKHHLWVQGPKKGGNWGERMMWRDATAQNKIQEEEYYCILTFFFFSNVEEGPEIQPLFVIVRCLAFYSCTYSITIICICWSALKESFGDPMFTLNFAINSQGFFERRTRNWMTPWWAENPLARGMWMQPSLWASLMGRCINGGRLVRGSTVTPPTIQHGMKSHARCAPKTQLEVGLVACNSTYT